jgi:hypothetical protein
VDNIYVQIAEKFKLKQSQTAVLNSIASAKDVGKVDNQEKRNIQLSAQTEDNDLERKNKKCCK